MVSPSYKRQLQLSIGQPERQLTQLQPQPPPQQLPPPPENPPDDVVELPLPVPFAALNTES